MDPVGRFESFAELFGGGRQRQLVVAYFFIISVVVLTYTVVYNVAMFRFEGIAQPAWESLGFVAQTLTTVGYGQDASKWTTWQMHLLVVFMQLSGFVIIVASLPVFIGPWLQDRLSTTAPTTLRSDVEGHVIIAGFTSRGRALIDELAARDIPYVVIERDRDAAADLYEQGIDVIHGDPESAAFCETCAGLTRARALVADIDDETNASVTLTAKTVCSVPVVTFVEDDSLAEYHRLAGADQVFSPRRLIGESLATKVTSGVSLDDALEIGEDFDIVELPVQPGCDLDGKTVRESGIRERVGANIVGAWFRGEFVSPPDPHARIDSQTILLVAGHEAQLEQLKTLTRSEKRRWHEGTVIVAGCGVVGAAVSTAVREADFPCTTVDLEAKDGVDVVGDVTEAETLLDAGIEDASTIILALPSDTMTVFTTLVVRDLNPEIEVVARADATESVRKVYQAGADYVLSLATVSGRMMASTILDEDVISFDRQVDVIRSEPGTLAGRTLKEADIRARTGGTVVAVERNGDLVANLDADFRIEDGDELVVTGTDDGINEFTRLVDGG